MSKKYIFRRKTDGVLIVYDEKDVKGKKHAEELMKNKKFELISTLESGDTQPKAFKAVPIVDDTLECPLCGKVVADDKELLKHRDKEHGTAKRGRPKKVQNSLCGEFQS